ncbi:MAG: hypothetical protein FWC08_01800 [Defluviitaleaceae bacterium]|nr:hypothetical protein [Defluviitaleaceae bacterium]
MSDNDVMELVLSDESDYFTVATELCLLPALLPFKLYSMMYRGHKVRNPVDLDGTFLKNSNWK